MSYAGLNTLPTDRATSILIGQYAESVNLQEYIKILMEEFNLMHSSSIKALTERTLSEAIGFQLEVLGEIVGQARESSRTIGGTYFGFNHAIGADTFGTVGDANAGSEFRSISSIEYINAIFNDDTYRKFIEARIVKNNRNITINVLIELVLKVITTPSVKITTNDDVSFDIEFPIALSDNDKLLLVSTNFIPKPVGIRFHLSDIDGSFI